MKVVWLGKSKENYIIIKYYREVISIFGNIHIDNQSNKKIQEKIIT